MAIEIVDLPIKHGGSFHSFSYVYQRVLYREVVSSLGVPINSTHDVSGISRWFPHDFPHVSPDFSHDFPCLPTIFHRYQLSLTMFIFGNQSIPLYYHTIPMGKTRSIPKHFSIIPFISGWWFGTFGLFFHILGISSSQLTNSYFSEG